jgi:hypothetical protein
MERPLQNIRPVGPFAQLQNRPGAAEVNIYFVEEAIPHSYIRAVENEVEDNLNFSGPVEGPVGVESNVVSFQTSGNNTSMDTLRELKDDVENEVPGRIRDIEVIF